MLKILIVMKSKTTKLSSRSIGVIEHASTDQDLERTDFKKTFQ